MCGNTTVDRGESQGIPSPNHPAKPLLLILESALEEIRSIPVFDFQLQICYNAS